MKRFSIIYTVTALFSVLLLGGAVVLANAQKHPSPPVLQGEEAKITHFMMGNNYFAVPVHYYEGLWRPENAPESWIKENRMNEAKFRNIFDGRCYKECVATQGDPEMRLLDLGGLEAAKKKLAEYKDEECHNPYYKAPDWPDYAQVGKEGNLCYHHFIYKSLFASVRFRTGDYPVESIPYLEKQARSFLDRFVQPMPAKGE